MNLSIWQIIFLAVLQGVTELFPISSLGHSVIIPGLLGWGNLINDTSCGGQSCFLPIIVALHLGTSIALVIYFWRDWLQIALTLAKNIKEGEVHTGTEEWVSWLIIIGIIPAAIKPELGFGAFFGGLAAGVVLGFLLFAPDWIGWHFSVFIVTDQRFIQITQKGLFHRAVSDIGLTQIQSINYEINGLQETMLGFGTIKMQTYVGDLVIRDVHHPAKTQKKLASILREEGVIVTSYPANQPTTADITNEEAEEA